MKCRRLKGYFTVEATLVMPIVVCIMALLCYLGFFMYNRCLLEQDAYRIGLRGSISTGLTNKETADYISEQGKDILSNYYAVSVLDKNIKVSMLEISVGLQGEMQVPFAFVSWEDKKLCREWEMQAVKELDRTQPVDFIRACRKVEKLVN